MEISNKHHLELIKELKKYAGKVTKEQQEREKRYDGTSKFCYVLKAATKTGIIKDWINQHPVLTLKEFQDLLDSLYTKSSSHEEISLAGRLLGSLPKLRERLNPQLLDRWLNEVEGWAETDSFCQSNLTARELLSQWKVWRSLLIKFSKDRNVHKRRASLVLLTGPIRQSNDPRLLELALLNISQLKNEKDILITKAISWLLRDMIKNHCSQVENYLTENQELLPKIAIRETKRKLSTGKK